MNWLFSRLTEPSTAAGIAAISQAAKYISPTWGAVFDAVTGLFGALAFALSEKPKAPPAQ